MILKVEHESTLKFVIDALYDAFAQGEEPNDLNIAMALTQLTPLSKLMAEDIASLRKWAKGRARLASTVPKHEALRRIAA